MDKDPLEELLDSFDHEQWEKNEKINPKYFSNSKWIRNHLEELEEYEGKWIAVYDQKLIAFGEEGAKVEEEALRQIGSDGSELCMGFLEPGNCIY